MTTRSRATSRGSRSSPCSGCGSTTSVAAKGVTVGAAALACALSGCQPNLGSPPSQITGPRILAVRADPAEAAPGSMVTYTALTVYGNNMGTGEPGPGITLPIDWAFCNQEKPLSDLSDISEFCFQYLDDASASFLVELPPSPSGASATGTMPSEACALFGPAVPPAMNGMPPGRPAD